MMLNQHQPVFLATLLFLIFIPTVIFSQRDPYLPNSYVINTDEQGSTSCDRNSCSPPTGDLLVGREANLSTTSTCGLYTSEKYCILGDTLKRKKCHVCDSRAVTKMRKNPLKYHGIENIVTKSGEDYRKFWWQAENGLERVSIRLDLGAEFHLTHIIMTFQTFRPAAMLIERSSDNGLTWKTYQYFASDCKREFKQVREGPRRSLKDVVCESQYSVVTPSYHGEVIFKVLPPNIPIRNPYSDEVQELLKMTNLRINFTKLHTLGDDLLDPRPEIRQKYYYAMMNMKVRGSCSCYGHASRCVRDDEQPDIDGMVYGKCACDHHTTGPNCKECEPFYQDAPWLPAIGPLTNECKRCNCNNHAKSCHFDKTLWIASGNQSGGRCDDCDHNTQGIHCEECKPTFYRNESRSIDDPYVCIPCNCEPDGITTVEGFCQTKADPLLGTVVAGQCSCKENVKGRRCDECKIGFRNFSKDNPLGCEACSCHTNGTLRNQGCHPRTGECFCKLNVVGRDCNACAKNHYGLDLFEEGCRPCNCEIGGSYSAQCDVKTGQCPCRPNVTGQKCDKIESGFYVPSLDALVYEAEKAEHSVGNVIPVMMPTPPSGQQRWTGDGFAQVYEKSFIDFAITVPHSARYEIVVRYQPPEPIWSQGSILIEPLAGGVVPRPESPCAKSFEYGARRLPFQFEAGRVFSQSGPYCFERDEKYRIRIDVGQRNGGYENSTISFDSIVLIPVVTDFEIFSDPSNAQRFDEYRRYRCEEYLYTMLRPSPPEECSKYYQSIALEMYNGSRPCNCDTTGSKSSICEPLGGKCKCQDNIIGRQCDSCSLGFYDFNSVGCKPCDCNSDGSLSFLCDIKSGQCACRDETYGRQCDECQPGFWNYPQCIRCECNGHATTCNSKTGACRDCLDFTEGHRCERCMKGYYGNPLIGINTPCRPCPCPGVPESGIFHAESCELDPNTNLPRCYCKPGHIGDRCDTCDENYFLSGQPIISDAGTLEIDKCIPCNCSNNIDISTPGNCDRRTGVCLKCIYNTEGDHCERCRKGFYGNAKSKQCFECECSMEGTNRTGEACNHETGQCSCLPNVVGTRCDKCEINFYNISSGVGCFPCGCDAQGSFNLRCSDDGQCSCRPGHGGKKCNECQPNHYGDPRIKCDFCDCNIEGSLTMQCHKVTGDCVCKPGIAGKKCDQCARGHLGTAPRCESCGECFENWDSTIKQLRDDTLRLIERARKIKQTGAPGAYGKLFVKIENKLIDAEILISGANVTDADIGNVNQTIKDLQKLAEQLNEKITEAEKDTEQTVQRTARANLRLDELRLTAKELENQNNLLRENTTKLKADDVRSGLNLTEDAARRAAIANKKVDDVLGDIHKSKNLRYSTEKLISVTNFEHEKSMENNRGSLSAISKKIKDLEDNIPDINKMVCGGRSTIDKCDHTCGGAGCSKCGDISCDAATTKAQSALTYGQDAEKKLKELRDKGEEEMRNIEEARRRSEEALREAQKAYDRAVATKNNSEAMSKEIQELFNLIDEFMSAQSATPAAIRTVAEDCLKIQISLTPDQILDLATKINATLKNVTNIEEILSATEVNLRRAQALEMDANITKNRADEILGMAREVLNALAIAQEAQNEAANSIKNANAQFNDAQTDLDAIAGETDNIARQSEQAQGKLEELQKKLDGLRISFTKNTYSVTQASKEAGIAGDMAKMAENDLEGLLRKFDEAKSKLAQKEKDSGLQKKQSDSIRTRAEKLAKDAGEKLRVLQDIEDNFTENEENLNKYAAEIDQMNRDMLSYLNIIETRSVFHKTCQT